ncbi:MAG: cytochrome c [Candidatus Sulfotelmatobacter sp.]|jgi:mono/diheme cytochrome c family protein
MLPNSLLTVFLLLSLLPVSPAQKPPSSPSHRPSAHIPLDGARIFQTRCASCHGADGRGHGPASVALKESLQDLTLISQRNGRRFPEQHVKDIIEGKQSAPPAHGSREMPIWGPIFHEVEADQDWGEVRLDAVTKYLESIQQK